MAKNNLERMVENYSRKVELIKSEIGKVIKGEEQLIEDMIKCWLCNGHALIEGVPGTGKTLMILSLSSTIAGAEFQRIQFTPDLLPSDITGTTVFEKDKGFYVQKGPVFANIVMGDEINRTPPKVQSAMLQAMQERQVTIGKQTYDLPKPFMVLATQNPLEQKGVYPLPEAQVDRFLFKLLTTYLDKEAEKDVIDNNVSVRNLSEFGIKEVLTLEEIERIQKIVKLIYSSDEIKEYIVKIVNATRRATEFGIEEGKYVQLGGSPRASIYLLLAAKATALINGRTYVVPEDVISVTHPVLRHRVLLNYEGKSLELESDDIIDAILKAIPIV